MAKSNFAKFKVKRTCPSRVMASAQRLRDPQTHQAGRPTGNRVKVECFGYKVRVKKNLRLMTSEVHTVCANYLDLYYSYQRRHP